MVCPMQRSAAHCLPAGFWQPAPPLPRSPAQDAAYAAEQSNQQHARNRAGLQASAPLHPQHRGLQPRRIGSLHRMVTPHAPGAQSQATTLGIALLAGMLLSSLSFFFALEFATFFFADSLQTRVLP